MLRNNTSSITVAASQNSRCPLLWERFTQQHSKAGAAATAASMKTSGCSCLRLLHLQLAPVSLQRFVHSVHRCWCCCCCLQATACASLCTVLSPTCTATGCHCIIAVLCAWCSLLLCLLLACRQQRVRVCARLGALLLPQLVASASL
jgi:hypothetical protein